MRWEPATALLLVLLTTTLVSAETSAPTEGQQALVEELSEYYQGHLSDLRAIAANADYAVLAWAAYGDPLALNRAKNRGWSPFKNFGLPSSPITGPAAATLFVSDEGTHVLAFRGTSDQLGDWVTNLAGTITEYETSIAYSQIRDAVEIAIDLASQHQGLVIVGHSLGARLAQVAALETNSRAVGFDRAPFGDVELQKWPSLLLEMPSGHERFKGWADPLTAVNPFASDDISVRNIVRSDDGTDYIYGHSIMLLALAMQDVRIAWDNGWLGDVKPAYQGAHSGVVFDGETKSISNESGTCQMSMSTSNSADQFRWSGPCDQGQPSGEGRLELYSDKKLLTYYKVASQYHLKFIDGILHWNMDMESYNFELTRCKVTYSGFRQVEITPKVRPMLDIFADEVVAQQMLKAGAYFATDECPVPRKGLSNIVVKASFSDDLLLRARSQSKEKIKWEEYENTALNHKWREVRDTNSRRERQERAAERERILLEQQKMRENFRLAMIEVKLKREVGAIKSWEKTLSSSQPWDNIADLLKYDPARTMAILSEGHDIELEVSTVDFSEGNVIVEGRHKYTDIYEGVQEEAKQRLGIDTSNDDRFTWGKWFEMINKASRDNYVRVRCSMEPKKAKNIKVSSRYLLDASLIDFSDPSYGEPIAQMECELEGMAQ